MNPLKALLNWLVGEAHAQFDRCACGRPGRLECSHCRASFCDDCFVEHITYPTD